MQRLGLALIGCVIALATGCFSDRGVAIEIAVGDTGATSVELYVGNTACTDRVNPAFRCKGGIAPPDLDGHLAGTVYFRDDQVPYRAAVRGGTATFRLQADDDTTLPIVIVVGSAGDSVTGTATLTDVLVPSGDGRLVKATLAKATGLTTSTTTNMADRARVWTQPGDAASTCVVVEHWTAGVVGRNFIVPPDDPDCDRVERECDPAAYLGSINRNGVDAAPQCFTSEGNGNGNGGDAACRLGAFGCTDATGPKSDVCLTTSDEVCVPKPFCECNGPTPDTDCPAGKVGNAGNVPHLQCTVRVTPVTNTACRDMSGVIDLHGHLGDAGCKQPELSGPLLAELPNRGKSHAFGSIDLELSSPDNACGFHVQVNGGAHPPFKDELGLIRLSVDNDAAVLLPVVFKFEQSAACLPAAMQCDFVEIPEDPMWDCVP